MKLREVTQEGYAGSGRMGPAGTGAQSCLAGDGDFMARRGLEKNVWNFFLFEASAVSHAESGFFCLAGKA